MERGAWKAALYCAGKPIAFSGRNAAESRSRAIRSQLVDIAAQIDFYITAFGSCVDAVSGQIESQVLGIHAGIIEGRNCGL
ncbi:MAG: hypothetical protein QG575_918 [Euryarchaeota archaeon]|nr:hypothetical protein [Euryarchaeota archaeon]